MSRRGVLEQPTLGLDPESREGVILPTSRDLPTVPCPRGCDAQVVVAFYAGRLLELDPRRDVYLWIDKPNGELFLMKPGNGLAVHHCTPHGAQP